MEDQLQQCREAEKECAQDVNIGRDTEKLLSMEQGHMRKREILAFALTKELKLEQRVLVFVASSRSGVA